MFRLWGLALWGPVLDGPAPTGSAIKQGFGDHGEPVEHPSGVEYPFPGVTFRPDGEFPLDQSQTGVPGILHPEFTLEFFKDAHNLVGRHGLDVYGGPLDPDQRGGGPHMNSHVVEDLSEPELAYFQNVFIHTMRKPSLDPTQVWRHFLPPDLGFRHAGCDIHIEGVVE